MKVEEKTTSCFEVRIDDGRGAMNHWMFPQNDYRKIIVLIDGFYCFIWSSTRFLEDINNLDLC